MKTTKEKMDKVKDSLKSLYERILASLIAKFVFEIVKHIFM